MKVVADEGGVFRPAIVEQVLDLQFDATTRETIHQPADCGGLSGDRSNVVTTYRARENWFKPTTAGVEHMKIPAAFINPAEVAGDPSISYKIVSRSDCTGEFFPLHSAEGSLMFYWLPAFACLTQGDIKQLVNATDVQATDGVHFLAYNGLTNDQYGTTIEFEFRLGAPCALSVEIRQDETFGYRGQRARLKFNACHDESNREYCAAHPDLTWKNRAGIEEMAKVARQACGTFASFYTREPMTGEPPVLHPPASSFRQTPCSGR